ncbi:HTH_Tnp_Tc3_2 domain-containing protein [Trichonephila clavipes]|nr:HTH_Tnp_Tc3_2 domain-containing protein [Trichonephila clavipes]
MVNNLVYRTSTGTVILLLRILTGRPLRLRLENPDISCRVRRRIIGEKTASHRHLKIKEVGATGTRVSRMIVSKRLHERGLFARRPAVCVPLTSTNRRICLAWRRQYRDWSMVHWATVLFTDESRFSLNTDPRRTFIRREPGTRATYSPMPAKSTIMAGEV